MMKRDSKSIFYLLVVILVILAILAVPVSAAKLATPTLIYPPNNYHSYSILGDFMCAWKPVPGATSYHIQIQQKFGANWVLCADHHCLGAFDWVPISNGIFQWRISAVNGIPADESNPTTWRTMTIGIEKKQLATPILVAPPSGVNFYHVPRHFKMDWKPVLDANRYKIDIQYYDPSLDTWVNAPNSPAYNGQVHITASHYASFPGPYKGRWRVEAQEITGAWLNSTPSAWRTFTFKN